MAKVWLMSPNARGAAFMALSMASFTLNDASIKAVADQMSMFQALFLRGIASTLMMVVMAAAMGGLTFRVPKKDRQLIVLRTIAEVAAAYFFITALFNMPIANASAIMQALPLTVTLAGAVFLGEPVGWRRLTAILIGFVGVMLIVRPGAEGFTVYSVYVVIAVICVTVRDLAARKVSAETPSMAVAIAASFGVWVFSAVGVLGEEWQPVDTGSALKLLVASVMIIGAYLFSILTMRVGDIAFVAPFRFTSLLWAILLGLVFFDEWPDMITLLGAAIVVGMGIFTFNRERKLVAESKGEQHRLAIGDASVDNPGDSH